jgi:oxygen-independent coproporphyrinogen-3 oxidase
MMLDAIRWDTDLIRRYDLAKRTSYPTAVQSAVRSARSTCSSTARSRKALRPLSLYVHVFCANICYYACNKVITMNAAAPCPICSG